MGREVFAARHAASLREEKEKREIAGGETGVVSTSRRHVSRQ